MLQMMDQAMRERLNNILNWGMLEIYDFADGNFGDSHYTHDMPNNDSAIIHLFSGDANNQGSGMFGGPQELLDTLCHEMAHVVSGQSDTGQEFQSAYRRCMGIA
jgi:hypothetical protein